MAELLWELVSRVHDLSKVTHSLVRLDIHMHKQNAKLIKLGKYQVFLVEQAREVGLGLGLGSGLYLGMEREEGKGSGKDKGKGKEKETEGMDETLGKSNEDLGLDSDEEEDGDMKTEE
jgi:hypothetical protein